MEKLNLDSLNNLINETGDIIHNDSSQFVEEDVMGINKDFEDIYSGIGGNKDSAILSFIKKIVGKDEGFEYKSFEGKIGAIFSRYDGTYDGLVSSEAMFSSYNEGLESEIAKIDTYLESNVDKIDGEDDEIDYRTIQVMKENLILTKSRIDLRLSSTRKLIKTMATNRPIFQTLLSSAMLEVSGQRAVDSSIKVIGAISGTISRISDKLTQSTNSTALIASSTRTQPIIYLEWIRKNLETLQLTVEKIKEEETKVLLLK